MAHTHYTVGEGYSSAAIQTAIDLIPGDLSDTGGGVHNVDVYYYDADDHSVPYAETLDISTGFTNASATDYIDVGAMVSHGGMRDSGIIIDVSGAIQFKVNCSSYTEFKGFNIIGPSVTYAGQSHYLYSAGARVKFISNILSNITINRADNFHLVSIYGVGALVANNQFMDCHETPSGSADHCRCISIRIDGTDVNPHQIHNNTGVKLDAYKGFGLWGQDHTYINANNNYFGDCTYAFIDLNGANCNINYNISSDGRADDFGGTGNLVSKAAVDQFESVVAGEENLRLKAGSDCFRRGQDNSALFTKDIVGSTRDFWTTGAFDFRSLAGGI